MLKILLLTVLLFCLNFCKGQSTNHFTKKDSIAYQNNKKLALPLGLMAVGTALNSSSLKRNQESWHRSQAAGFSTSLDDYLALTPNFLALTMNHLGIKSKSNARDKFFLIGFSNAISMAGTYLLKNTSRQLRPDKTEKNSFSSGHTAMAFTGAQIIHEEYGHHGVGVSIAAYSMASAVAGMRIANNRHWLADVVFGAGYGMLSTKLAYRYYPKIKPKLGKIAHKNQVKIDPLLYKDFIGTSFKLSF